MIKIANAHFTTHSWWVYSWMQCLHWYYYQTHSYMCHDSFIHVPWLIHTYAMTHFNTCAMTHSYMCHDSFIHVPWLIHTCAMTHSYMCHDSFIYVTWLIVVIRRQALRRKGHCIHEYTHYEWVVMCALPIFIISNDLYHLYFIISYEVAANTHLRDSLLSKSLQVSHFWVVQKRL